MRYIFRAFFVFIIVVCGCTGVFASDSAEGSVSGQQYLRVGLDYGSSAVSSVTVSCSGGLFIVKMTEGGFLESVPLSSCTQAVITEEDGAFVVRDSSGTVLTEDLGADGVIVPYDYGGTATVRYKNAEYRGGIAVSANSGDTLNVINYIGVEEYLRGVVSAEIGRSSGREALKAQAIAARSYAIKNLNTHKSQGFDVCDTVHCQVYRGCAGEYAETDAAVEETEGLVVYYGGKVVPCYYSKNSGGYTEDVRDVWGSSVGYLKAVYDPFSPDYPWSKSYTKGDLQTKLAAVGHSIGTLETVAITERYASGSVSKLVFQGSSGSYTMSGAQFVSLMGASVIKTGKFTVDSAAVTHSTSSEAPAGSVSSGASEKASAVFLSNGSSLISAETLYAVSAGGKTAKLSTDGLYLTNGKATVMAKRDDSAAEPETSAEKPSKNVYFTQLSKVSSDTIWFNGLGYGHCVGMAQDGAIQMAKQGYSYDAILNYYYTGITIGTYNEN